MAHGAVQPPPVNVNSAVGFGVDSSFLQELKVKRPKTANRVKIICFIFYFLICPIFWLFCCHTVFDGFCSIGILSAAKITIFLQTSEKQKVQKIHIVHASSLTACSVCRNASSRCFWSVFTYPRNCFQLQTRGGPCLVFIRARNGLVGWHCQSLFLFQSWVQSQHSLPEIQKGLLLFLAGTVHWRPEAWVVQSGKFKVQRNSEWVVVVVIDNGNCRMKARGLWSSKWKVQGSKKFRMGCCYR